MTWRLAGGVSRADFPLSSMWRLSLGAAAVASVHPVICGKKASARQGEAASYQTDGRQDIAEENMGSTPTAHDSST